MAIEIERKYLVTSDDWRATPGIRVTQGYLALERSHSVRVRIADERAWLTIKGEARQGIKPEFEYPIPLNDAQQLMTMSPSPLIEKMRHAVEYDGFIWEVDEFLGANAGLVVAEIELDSPERKFPLPDWIGRDVTDDPRYLNANLARHPFSAWRDNPAGRMAR